jgi:integrase
MRDASGRWLEWGSPAFCELYKALRFGRAAPAIVADKVARLDRKDENSLAWLIGKFRASKEWPTKKSTAANYNSIFNRIEAKNGHKPYRDVTAKAIADYRDEIAETAPTSANKFVSVLRVMFAWAASKEAGPLVDANPAVGVTMVEIDEEHHPMWTDEDRAKFEKHWARGTRERLAFALLYATGQRRSDVVLMGPKSLTRDGKVMNLVQVKTGKPVAIPMPTKWAPELKAEIAAARVTGADTFIVGDAGKPMTADHFGRWFGAAAKAAGLADRTAHGLRRSASASAVEAGYTAGQLCTVFGYTLAQAEAYIKEFSREKVARALLAADAEDVAASA